MTDGWEVGTYAGLERVRARELARLTPQQRLAWLEEAQELAHASGALSRSRAAKQRAIDTLWGGHGPVTVPPGG